MRFSNRELHRILVAVGGEEAPAYTRSGLDWSGRFPSVLSAARKLKVRSALIDDEAVVIDAEGRSSFHALQNAVKGNPASIDFYAFDLLQLDGEDLTRLPLLERKKKLEEILPAKSPILRYSDHIQGRGEELLSQDHGSAGTEGRHRRSTARGGPRRTLAASETCRRDRVYRDDQ